jgi:hypothetical protein
MALRVVVTNTTPEKLTVTRILKTTLVLYHLRLVLTRKNTKESLCVYTDGWMSRYMDGRLDGWLGRCVDAWVGERISRQPLCVREAYTFITLLCIDYELKEDSRLHSLNLIH